MNPPNDWQARQTNSTSVEPEVESSEKVKVEEFEISGDNLVDKVKELIHQGNIRRITVKKAQGQILLEFPLTVGVVGGLISITFFPILAALGAIGALVARLRIVIERKG
ncbi:MAG: DUF4342 domain-containing protein [Symploca sp. SIO2E9]|nr:DUF4342 domain-containing protein [Symploca sp. SIO2E9]